MAFDERSNKFICDKLGCSKTATVGHTYCYEHLQKELIKPVKEEASQ